MIDLSHLEKYKENNRIEAKRAVGGLPYSVWETYSSFANTMGGIILLGVEEGKDKHFHAVKLPDPAALAAKFWRQVNDPRRVNKNILTKDHVRVERAGNREIVVIEVPRAARYDKPIYIDNDPQKGTYRRGGEGDYRCIPAEIEAMRREAAAETADMKILEKVSISALNMRTVNAYRAEMEALRPGHICNRLEPIEFLVRLGAAARDTDGIPHPTKAGLLLFGFAGAIREILPDFNPVISLDPALFQLKSDTVCRVNTDNLYDFYTDASAVLGGIFPRSKAACFVLGEALVNAIVNADHEMPHNLTVEAESTAIRFANAGAFRINKDRAKVGGVSDARNKGLARLFTMIGAGAGIGGGIPRMIAAWKKCGHSLPIFSESDGGTHTLLTLPLSRKTPLSPATGAKKRALPAPIAKQMVAEYLTGRIAATAAEMAGDIGMGQGRINALLCEMLNEGLIISDGVGKSRRFRLREKAGL